MSYEKRFKEITNDSGMGVYGLAELAGREADERIAALETALEDAKGFSEWVEILGRTDCEIYKHELKSSADLSIERIDKALGI